MGYCMEQVDSKFHIKKENFEKALQTLKTKNPQGNFINKDENEFIDCRTIFEALDKRCWHLIEDGDINEICFEGEKSHSDLELFDSFAEFVEKGSYIQMSGEDGEIWRWVFDGKTCEAICPKITWKD